MLFATLALVAISLAFACTAIVLCFRASASLQFVKDNAETIKITLATVAALYTAWVYYIEMRDNRVANTLQYQEMTTAPHLQEAFASLDVFWIRGPGTHSLCSFRVKICRSPSAEEYTNIDDNFAKKTNGFIRTYGLESEVFAIHAFYKDVAVCVDQGRCHRETACELFASDIENFRLIYREFLDEWDALWQTGVSMDLQNFYDDCDMDTGQIDVDETACEWLSTTSPVDPGAQLSPDVITGSRCASSEMPNVSSYSNRH